MLVFNNILTQIATDNDYYFNLVVFKALASIVNSPYYKTRCLYDELLGSNKEEQNE